MFLVSLLLPFCIDKIWFMYFQYKFQFIYLLTEKQNTLTFLSLSLSLLSLRFTGKVIDSRVRAFDKLAELDFKWKNKNQNKKATGNSWG